MANDQVHWPQTSGRHAMVNDPVRRRRTSGRQAMVNDQVHIPNKVPIRMHKRLNRQKWVVLLRRRTDTVQLKPA